MTSTPESVDGTGHACDACFGTTVCAICNGHTVLLAEPPGGSRPCTSCQGSGTCRYCAADREPVRPR